MPYISDYTIIEDGDCYRIRLTNGEKYYDGEVIENLQVAILELETLQKGDGV